MRSKKHQRLTAIIIVVVIAAMVLTTVCSGFLMGM